VALLTAVLSGCGLIGGSGAAPSTSASSEPPVPPRTGPAETRTDVAYASASPKQTLDLFLPAGDGTTVYPLVVLIHGGGFYSGRASELDWRAKMLSTKGFAAASLNYRLSGDAPYPAALQDVAAALRYLKANARSWGVDPHRVAVWGESAGGYLAAMTGAAGAPSRFDDAALGNPGVSSQVQAVVSWFGPTDFATMDDQARAAGCGAEGQAHHQKDSPESRWLGAPIAAIPDEVKQASVVRAAKKASELPPFLLVHGERDCTVPPGQSKELRDVLEQRSAKVTLTLVPDAGHADQLIADTQTKTTIAFLRKVFAIQGHADGA
jgi:acetyl esterase/lipase